MRKINEIPQGLPESRYAYLRVRRVQVPHNRQPVPCWDQAVDHIQSWDPSATSNRRIYRRSTAWLGSNVTFRGGAASATENSAGSLPVLTHSVMVFPRVT